MDLSSRGRKPQDPEAQNYQNQRTVMFHSLYISTAQNRLHGLLALPIQNVRDAENISPNMKRDLGADSECLAGGLKLSGSTE